MINKKPFTGPQGKITRDFFVEAGFDEERILYTNVLLCSCAMSPTKTFLSNCALQLDQTLDIINPVLVIALGDVASRRLTNKPLTDTRGKLVKYRSFPVFSIIHTAAIARQRSEIEAAKMSGLVVGDLQNAKVLHEQFLAMRKGR